MTEGGRRIQDGPTKKRSKRGPGWKDQKGWPSQEREKKSEGKSPLKEKGEGSPL